MKLIAIEGGISAGKSTLLPALSAHMKELTNEEWNVIKEPVDEDQEFHRLLKQFIDNPTDANKRAEFQMYMTRQRHDLLQEIPDGNYIIERSLFSDLVFTQCNMLSTEGPTGAYQASYYDIKEHLNTYPKVDLVVYLDREPEACLNSMKMRDRDGEAAYHLDYFEDLHRFHMTCLPQITRIYNTKYLPIQLGWSFPDARIVAPKILEVL
jgi:deoxyadenosine/deoxycytidine kinase